MGQYLNWLPEACETTGYPVTVFDDWKSNNHGPMADHVYGVICHHTAGAEPPRDSQFPTINVVRRGRPGLEGPLCNVGLGFGGRIYVVSNGVAYHGGTGSWRGQSGNSRFVGIEAEDSGDGDWDPAQLDCYPRLVAALLDWLGEGEEWAVAHREYAPGRKIDPAGIDMARFRATVGTYLRDPAARRRGGAPSLAPAGGEHTVVAGDTLWGLSRRYAVTVDQLRAWNGLAGDALSIGRRLRVAAPSAPAPAPAPAPGELQHIVVAGDTLWGISRRYGVTVDALRSANGLVGDALSIGRRLRVPAPTAAPAALVAPPAPAPAPAPAPSSGPARVLAEFGMLRPDEIVALADHVGVQLPVAAAFLEQESSTARNVWGHDGVDPQGLYVKGAEVTPADYVAYAARRKHHNGAPLAGEVDTQGVGPLQITHWSLQDECDGRFAAVGGGTWVWEHNVEYGLGLIRRYLIDAVGTADPIWEAAKRYNGKASYADELRPKVDQWRERLRGVVTPPPPHAPEVDPQPAQEPVPDPTPPAAVFVDPAGPWGVPLPDLYYSPPGPPLTAAETVAWAAAHAAHARDAAERVERLVTELLNRQPPA